MAFVGRRWAAGEVVLLRLFQKEASSTSLSQVTLKPFQVLQGQIFFSPTPMQLC